MQDKYFWRNIITRSILVISTILLIVWVLPRTDSQTFRYDVGKPWMYGSFIAKFDFPVYKTDEVMKRERDSVLQSFQPYYVLNANVEKQQVNKLQQDFSEGMPGLPDDYLRIITNRLHRIYQSGVMNVPDYNRMAIDSTAMIRIVNGKEAESQNISYVYSTRTAYEQLFVDEELGELRQALQKCNLNEYIEPNIYYDRTRTESERADLIASIPASKGMVISGQKIIDRGEIVDEYTARVLDSFEREKNRRTTGSDAVFYTLIGQLIYVTTLVLLFTVYIYLFRRDYMDKPKSLMMLYMHILIFPMLVSFVMRHNIFSVYVIPMCICPIFVRVFMDSRTAFVTHITMVLLSAAAVTYQFEFVFIQTVAGMVAEFSLREMSKRSQVLRTAFFVSVASMLAYYALTLIQSGDDLRFDKDIIYHFVTCGVLTLLAYPLMYIIERTFDFNSDITLFELSNTNKGLLRQLSEEAPGTFQHSVMVGNLAAAVAQRINANPLLVRTGALYHDIGKLGSPAFFTENQAGVNPHENMSNVQSAQIIVSHVRNGIALAEKNSLPQFIKDFILTHHGRGMARYFYIMEKNANPGETIDPAPFSYPGPNPFTREQAILMMADSAEAATRSLSQYTEDSITDIVNRVIDSQVSDGFFRECPITFRDISVAKKMLIERLKNLYHARISYPEEKK